jgi:hypothetical protein
MEILPLPRRVLYEYSTVYIVFKLNRPPRVGETEQRLIKRQDAPLTLFAPQKPGFNY